MSSGWCAKSGTGTPSAWKISICAAVLVTWSSPRMTWLTVEFGVVDDRRQRIEKPPVGADQHRVADRGGVDFDLAADQIAPCHLAVGQEKPPMRHPALGLQRAAFGRGEVQARAVVHGRRAAHLARACACVRALPASRSRDRGAPRPSAFRPPRWCAPSREDWRAKTSWMTPSQPRSRRIASSNSGLERSASVSSMRSRNFPPCRSGEQEVQHRRARVSGMQQPGGRRREADERVSGHRGTHW